MKFSCIDIGPQLQGHTLLLKPKFQPYLSNTADYELGIFQIKNFIDPSVRFHLVARYISDVITRPTN